MNDDKFEFDPTCRYGERILWEPLEPTRLEKDANVLLPPSTRSEALKFIRQSVAEIVPHDFRSKVKISSSVIMHHLREWRVFDWSYEPSS